MILPGSYANGFAPRDGQPLYPELWRGCVSAWAPCLGPTGLTLRDWSGFGRHGAFTNMLATDWTVSGGRYALSTNLAASNQCVTVAGGGTSTPENTLAMWLRLTAYNSFGNIPFNSGTGTSYYFQIMASGTSVSTDSPSFTIPSTTWTDGTWRHVAFTVDNAGTKLYINGIQAGSSASKIPGSVDASQILIGKYYAGTSWSHKGQVDDIRTYRRALSAKEIALLASRRGIAYELAQRRRASSGVAFNRRRRLLVGAGS